ncbi:MAG: HAMP domain-containing histidine kinase [Saprospiraceae bacterium]|nr:HAMP domain-containing histidine kinase [Saprospiraceae bacterium]HMX88386.1 HAMP domain-containing sensor histidine kinase [Saprospiraceae bacterium]HMZ40278.1 HAMP domain-containing sensor histidine kinase [Saprospiraceae bacterium]HNA64055.1 HAMP domain-containing sensor histidine kinase [Saprospiraceae bacterium]HNB31042.1 HAMP domain-containing sensor histidine kinase [Saprospiraceae bacterium]
MDLYLRTNTWNFYLIVFGAIILLLPVYLSNRLAHNLASREKTNVELFIRTLEESNRAATTEEDFTYVLDMQTALAKEIHVVTLNDNDVYQFWNYGEHPDSAAIIHRVTQSNNFIETQVYPRIYYEYPEIITLIRYLPWIQLLLLLSYAAIGYFVFNLSRREEQNRVWVGMAKETAHQLGTPISGMIGWIEQLKAGNQSELSKEEIIHYIEQDITKLEQVSDRFSKIGSRSVLEPCSALSMLAEAEAYIRPRASKRIKFDFPVATASDHLVMANRNLISWVLENVLRNALDAMEGQGTITARLEASSNKVLILISDTGSGIPPGKFQTIFLPGYSTKSRGWGLGLSLARRIIENYHGGKIYVRESTPSVKTTFVIELNKA